MYTDELIDAVDDDDFDEIKILVNKGGMINYQILYEIIFNNENIDLLKNVIKYSSIDEISKALLKVINKCNDIPIDFFKILINTGGTLNLDKNELTDLLYKVIIKGCKDLEIVKFLIKSGAIIDQEIIHAAHDVGNRYNDSTILEYLLERLNMTKQLAKLWINDWVFKKMQHKKKFIDLPIGIEKYFKRTKQETLYRGLYWSSNDIKDSLRKLINTGDYSKYKTGNNIKINLRDLTSWSKKEYIAVDFAKMSVIGNKKLDNTDRYGVLLAVNVTDKNILADVNLTLAIRHEEQEVILYPGKYECQILKIFYNGKEVDSLLFNLYKDVYI